MLLYFYNFLFNLFTNNCEKKGTYRLQIGLITPYFFRNFFHLKCILNIHFVILQRQRKNMNIAVVGGGAAGLFLTEKLSENPSANIFVFEKQKKIGTKVKASCGGKANILNTCILPSHYNDARFMSRFLQQVSAQDVLAEFDKMGLKTIEDEEHRVFPSTLFSENVLQVLLENFSTNVKILTETLVQQITRKQNHWQINNLDIPFDKVILATGSPAGLRLEKQKNYNVLLSSFSLKFNSLQPSLVGFKLQNFPTELFGCRTKAIVSLYQKQNLLLREKGEVVFKEDGISGIVILNCSAYYNRLTDKSDCYLSLNFLYDNENYDVAKHWQRHHSFAGLLHPKLYTVYQKQPFDIRNFKLKISGTYEMDAAQVAHGGIDTSEIDEHFQLKKYPGIYAIGEMLDIDGVCGGYNLFFAFASALLSAKYILNGN